MKKSIVFGQCFYFILHTDILKRR